MNENSRVRRLLELLIYLSSGLRYSLPEIAERFSISERTVYRDLCTLREVGFIIPEPAGGRYYIDKDTPYFREISELLHFSREEAILLNKVIHAISDENLLKQNLIKKLYALYDFDRVADTIVEPKHAATIHSLIKAIKAKKRVLLRGYFSANSGQISDRLVEPFEFTANYLATWAYDLADQSCKTFKNTRITSVEVQPDSWKFEHLHKPLPIDVFRMTADKWTKVGLRLNLRAVELLKEEYPLAEQHILPSENDGYHLICEVAGFEGVGRYIMGLHDEIEILYPDSLKTFIRNKAKTILTDVN